MRLLPILILASILHACGGGSGDNDLPAADGPFEERCQQHCTIAGELACSEDDKATCLQECRAQTSGLAFTCGACLIDSGVALYDSANVCDEAYIPGLTEEDCADFCGDANHPGTSDDTEVRCQQHCAITGDLACSEADRTTCLQECRSQTSGLAFACGVCLIDSGVALYDSANVCDEAYIPGLTEEDCVGFCQ